LPRAGCRRRRRGEVMDRLTEPQAMQLWSDVARGRGERIALVPTMGALHAGHLALVDEARRRCNRVGVSIFGNPMQVNQREDFEKYPRTLDEDARMLEEAHVDALYAPAPVAMYPEGFQSHVEVERLSAPLCGAARPGHFRGVTTVVTKLFHAVRPHVAVFGEKDYQQLAVVRRMTADFDFGIEVVGVPTVREADGLALSSRNRLLGADDRMAARAVPRALDAAAELVAAGRRGKTELLDRAAAGVAAEARARLRYAGGVRGPTLAEVAEVTAPTLLALAVWVGGVRLIDNRVLLAGGTSS